MSHQLGPATQREDVACRVCLVCGGRDLRREAGGRTLVGHDLRLESPCGESSADPAVSVAFDGRRLMSFWPVGTRALSFTTVAGSSGLIKIPSEKAIRHA